jgi:hypothetical protein
MIGQANVLDDGVNECLLGELVGAILGFLVVYANIASWVALILNVEASVLDIEDGLLEQLVIWSKKDALST